MVGEKRYFECAAKHGLFAPLHKVTRSPKNRMMRERSSLTPGKLRRCVCQTTNEAKARLRELTSV